MERSAVRRVYFCLLLFACLLGVQYFLLGTVGEPYPAILLPGFKGGVKDFGDSYERVAPEVTFWAEDKTPTTVSWDQLLESLPNSQHRPLSKTLLSRIQEPSRVSQSPKLRAFIHQIFPGLRAFYPVPTVERDNASLGRWLRKRGKEIMPGKEFTGAQIQWVLYRLSVEKKGPKVPLREIATLKLEFRENEGE